MNRIRKILAIILVLVMMMGLFTGIAAAASERIENIYLLGLPRGGGERTGWGHGDMSFMNGWSSSGVNWFVAKSVGGYDGPTAYCIEIGVGIEIGDSLNYKGEEFWDDFPPSLNSTIEPGIIKALIGRTMQYGWTGNNNSSWSMDNAAHRAEMAEMIATQMLIWEILVGERNGSFAHVSASGGLNNIMDMIADNHPLYDDIYGHYTRIVASVQSHTKVPSFCGRSTGTAGSYSLAYDGEGYSITLTDTNNVLANYEFTSSNPDMSFSFDGNKLTISTDSAPSGDVLITANKKNSERVGIITWTDYIFSSLGSGQVQDVITYGELLTDPVVGYLNIGVSYGSGSVTKTSEDGILEGFAFHLYGISEDEEDVSIYATTDSSGSVDFTEVPIGDYTIAEVNVPIRYVIPASQSVSVSGDRSVSASFHNALKKWNVVLTKSDREMGISQGDASLAGAVYGIYNGGSLVDTYVTDANGSFTTAYYICGDNWTVREISPSEGYLLDSTVYSIGASARLYTVEYSTTRNNVTEQVIKGQVSIIKHTDDGSTQIETPEEGAEFEIFLKSSGSYDAARATERDYLVCDENGYAITKALPYGVYTVRQISGWEGKVLLDDFDVFVSEDGEVYRYIINNRVFESYIKIVKTDAETGKTIPYEGAAFEIYDTDGNKISMTFTYPEITTVDTFYTTVDGYLITPEKLEYGKGYSLVEVHAPYGYVLDETPIYFDVMEDNSEEDSGIVLIRVDRPNMPQKGVISVAKTGEVFSTVEESGNRYTPKYEVRGLAGAVYELKASENIVTPDGTLRYYAGEIVDTITTGDDGIGRSIELYLGSYEIYEIEAPYGMTLNDEVHEFELTYRGEEIDVFEIDTGFHNERQRVEIQIPKWMEHDYNYGIGMNGEIGSVSFAIYAAEDIIAVDGTIIPKDGLIEVISLHAGSRDLPFGSYYLVEYSTDIHYSYWSTRYPITFEYAGQDTSVVTIRLNDGISISNTIKRGTVSGKKLTEDGEGLGGAVIGIFHPNETTFNASTAIDTTTSKDDGSFSFSGVPYGEWIIREISAPTGFVLNDECYRISIPHSGAVAYVEIANKWIRGNLRLTKVDEDYPDNKLSGAEFEVYRDGELVGKLEETKGGIYTLDDLKYGEYIVRETIAPDGFYLDEGEYSVFIAENGKTYDIENHAGSGFVNAPHRGSIRIIKTSSDDTIEGFSFRITGEGYDEIFVTDENGVILIKDLRIGEYIISEIADEVSSGYTLPENAVVSVTEGETTEITMHNQRDEVPQTGDVADLAVWAVMLCAAIGAIVGLVVVNRKKRK